MNELEKMQKAKLYMDKLANGVDPLTDTELQGDTVLNNVSLARCFFYVGEVLGKVISNGGVVSSTGNKARFNIADEQRSAILITPESVGVNEIARRINAVIDTKTMTGATGVKINNWLVGQGLLQIETRDDKQVKVVTPEGEAAGISTVDVTTLDGRTFLKNVFAENMQRFIIERIDLIINGG